MWIRTQNKERLVEAHLIELLTYEDHKGNLKCDIISVIENAYERILGKYSTKEKALKVLDMIQEHLKNMYIGIGTYMGKPFQMPQDSEVE